MIVLGFTVTFHSPFRVGSAYARDGVDAALDRHDPLPPDHLKGLMRAAAARPARRARLSLGRRGVRQPPEPVAVVWSAADPGRQQWKFSVRHRVAIDQDTHSARQRPPRARRASLGTRRPVRGHPGRHARCQQAAEPARAGPAVRRIGRARPGRLAAARPGLGRHHPGRRPGDRAPMIAELMNLAAVTR